MATLLGSPRTKITVVQQSISIKSYQITSYHFNCVNDVTNSLTIAYVTKDVSGNILEQLSYQVTGSALTTLMSATVSTGVQRDDELRTALYNFMVSPAAVFV